MNDHDKENLNFLLTASPEVLKDWYDSVEEDDHMYAQELLAMYSEEIEQNQALEELEAGFEAKLAEMNAFPMVEALLSKLIH